MLNEIMGAVGHFVQLPDLVKSSHRCLFFSKDTGIFSYKATQQ